jgi:hypothetical protein
MLTQSNQQAHEQVVQEQGPQAGDPQPKLSVVHGELYYAAQIAQRAEDFWTICRALFWPAKEFNGEQLIALKYMIAQHFKGSQEINETFKQLVERAALGKRCMLRNPGYTEEETAIWLDIHNKEGLTGTARLYQKLQEQRLSIPHFEMGLKIFSEAVLAFCQHRSPLDVRRYQQQFVRLNQGDLLQMYLTIVAQIIFINN